MHRFIIWILIMGAFACTYGQDFNRVVFDEKAQKDVMKGFCDEEGLKTTVWSDFYETAYNSYQPDMERIILLMPLMQGVKIVVTLGTWCGDSKQHVPAFLRILSELKFDVANLTIIALDRNFDSGEQGIRPYDTEKVPTFIFFSGDVELGRIIETPDGTLEEHMMKILGN